MKIIGVVVLDNGIDVPFTGVEYPEQVTIEQIFKDITQEAKEEATKLYLELNKVFIRNIPDELSSLYRNATNMLQNYKKGKPPVSPIRCSLLSVYLVCVQRQLKIEQVYFVCEDQKQVLEMPIVKYFDANLKEVDKNTSQIRS